MWYFRFLKSKHKKFQEFFLPSSEKKKSHLSVHVMAPTLQLAQAWSLKKIQDFNGILTHDLAIPVRCSHQLPSYEATDVGSWSIMCSYVPIRDDCDKCIWNKSYMRTAEMCSQLLGSFFIWFSYMIYFI